MLHTTQPTSTPPLAHTKAPYCNRQHTLPLLLCIHPSSSPPPYPLTKYLDKYFFLLLFFHLISNRGRTLVVTTLPPSPRVHTGHPRLLSTRPVAAYHRIDPVAHATCQPHRAQPPPPHCRTNQHHHCCYHPSLRHVIKTGRKSEPGLPLHPLTSRCYPFTN